LQQEANCEGELDIEGEGSFDEYTWAGQTRIRASSLIDGGLGGKYTSTSRVGCCHLVCYY